MHVNGPHLVRDRRERHHSQLRSPDAPNHQRAHRRHCEKEACMPIQRSSRRRCSFLFFLLSIFVIYPMRGYATDAKLAVITSAVESILKMTEGSVKLSEYQKKLEEVEATVRKVG